MLGDSHRQAGKPLGSHHKESGCPSLARPCQRASGSAGSTHCQFSLRTGSRCPEGSEGAGSRGGAQAHPSPERPPPHADVRAPPAGCLCSDWLAPPGPI